MVFYFRFSFIGYWYFYIVGGGKLVSLGGSWYFLISGLFITISAISIFRKKRWVSDFCCCFVGTVIWSLIDAGWEFWPLFSRLMFPAGLLLRCYLPYLQFDATTSNELGIFSLCRRWLSCGGYVDCALSNVSTASNSSKLR